MLVYIDDREDEELKDDYGYDYGCDGESYDYEYNPEKKSYDSSESEGGFF